MKEFVALRAKTYAYLMDDDSKHKKAKGVKKCVIKRGLLFDNYRDSLLNDKIILKSQQRFKSDHHIVYTEEVNKIALSSNDDKRIQIFDKVTTYPLGRNVYKLCENEMKIVCNAKETLGKNDELYMTSSIFLNYMKRKCTAEMKKVCKI